MLHADNFAVEHSPCVHEPGNHQIVICRNPSYPGVPEIDSDGEVIEFVVRVTSHLQHGTFLQLWGDVLDVLAVGGPCHIHVQHEDLLRERH